MLLWKTAADSRTLLRALVTVLFVSAMAALALAALFGFEEPNDTLLLLSSGLLVAAIVAVFAHLSLTRILSRAQKRIWFHQLAGPRAVWAFAEYLTCENLRTAAIRFAEDASAHR
jgi:hypothetical protein